VSPDSPLCRWIGWQPACLNAKGQLLNNSPEGTDGKAVSTLRFRAETSDVIAVGLENGEIQLRNVRTQRREQQFSQQKSDRVFDLVFSKDSFNLFSGHGKFLRHWRLESEQGQLKVEIDRKFAIYALALTKSPDPNLDEKYLVLAGRYNRIQLWDWKAGADRFYAMDYPRGTANDYITSIATGMGNRLVTADTRGRVQVWSLAPCLNLGAADQGATSTAITTPTRTTPATVTPATVTQCKAELLDSWQLDYDNGLPMPLRSIALSQDEPYLAAVGDDGVIRLWKIGNDGKRQPGFADAGREIARHPRALNSVDLIVRGQNLLIVTGCADHQVRLNLFPLD
jgi:WD40 repeat protein